MPAIPTYQSQSQPRAIPEFGRATASGLGEGIARAGEAIGQFTQNKMQQQISREEQEQASRAQATLAQTRQLMTERVTALQQESPADPTGFTARVSQEYRDYSQKLINQPSLSAYERRLLERGLSDIGESVGANALAFESRGRTEYRSLQVGNSLNQLANVVARDGSQYDDVFNQGLETIALSGLSAIEVEKLQTAWRSDATKAYLLGQVERNPQAVISALDGGRYDDRLDARARASLYNSAQVGVKQREAERRASTTAARAALNGVEKRLEAGLPLPPEEAATVSDIVKAAGTPEIQALWDSMRNNQQVMQQAALLSPQQISEVLTTQVLPKLQENGATQAEFNLYKSLTALQQNMQTELKNDPMTYAARTGAVQLQPLDFSSPQAATSSIAARAAAAEGVAGRYGIEPKLLTEGEAMQMTTAMLGSTVQDQVAVASALRASLTPRQAQTFYRQVGQSQPALGYIMALPDEMNAGRAAALNGLRVMKEFPDIVPKALFDGHAQADSFRQKIRNLPPEVQGQMVDTVKAVAADRVSRGATYNQRLFDQAVTDTIGQTGRVNGGEVILPAGVDDNSLERAIGRLTDGDLRRFSVSEMPPVDLRGNPLPPDAMKRYRPATYGDGVYIFLDRQGSAVMDAAGDLFMLRMNQQNVSLLLNPPAAAPPPPAPAVPEMASAPTGIKTEPYVRPLDR